MLKLTKRSDWKRRRRNRNHKRKKVSKIVVSLIVATSLVIPSSSFILEGKADVELTPMTEPVVVSNVIPVNTIDNTLNNEVLEEIKLQEAVEDKVAKQIKEEKRLAKIKTQRKYIKSIICDPKNVNKVTGLKKADYKILTMGTWWEGKEDALIALEKTYGVNAMFAMSVSTLESDFGRSDRAKSKNNYYGIELPKHWKSLYTNTQTFGFIIKNYYVECDRLSVNRISTKYCPPNHEYWAKFVSDNMNKLYSKLVSRMNATNK